MSDEGDDSFFTNNGLIKYVTSYHHAKEACCFQWLNIFKQSGILFYQGRQLISGFFSKRQAGVKISKISLAIYDEILQSKRFLTR